MAEKGWRDLLADIDLRENRLSGSFIYPCKSGQTEKVVVICFVLLSCIVLLPHQ